MENITYVLYSISTDKLLRWGDPDSGKSLKAAYDAALMYCNTKDDPNAKKDDLKILVMQNDAFTYEYTLVNAWKFIREAEIAKEAKLERQKELEAPPETPAIVEDVPAQTGVDEVIPNTNTAPWRISQTVYEDAYGIEDREGKLVAKAMIHADTEGHVETNARLIEMAPELSQLATNIYQALSNKGDNVRTNDEDAFINGMKILYGAQDMQVDVDILDEESRRILWALIDNVTLLYENISMLMKHGSPTPEIINDLNSSLEKSIHSTWDVKTHLL